MTQKRERLDTLLVQQGLAPSREKARAYVMAGMVLIGDTPACKPGLRVDKSAPIRLRGLDHPYVSRGGLKLEAALRQFQLDCRGKIALDLGASTGGFSDCLLQAGACRVYAVDVGQKQLHEKLRNDARVENLEKTNAKSLNPYLIPERIDILVADLSFISLSKCLAAAVPLLREGAESICLFKPQFEVGADLVGKGGVVPDEQVRLKALFAFLQEVEGLGLWHQGYITSPIQGKKKRNTEYLVHLRRMHR